ncbi:LicD family protein [Dellaglioa sp. L3N]
MKGELILKRDELLTLEEIQKIEFNILEYVVKILDENNLVYCLDGGTLLGAVRHHGFIPWDDDVDLVMPRRDYMKFIKTFRESDRYKMLSPYDETRFKVPYIKIVDNTTTLRERQSRISGGAFIDIFPSDNLPENKKKNKLYLMKVRIVRSLITVTLIIHPDSVKTLILWIIGKFLSNNILNKYFDLLVQKYNKTDSKRVSLLVIKGQSLTDKEGFPEEWFTNRKKLKFNGIDFFVPGEYKAYLKHNYGNFMEIPDLAHQGTHKLEVSWKK